MFWLLLLRVPVGIALGITGVLGLWGMGSLSGAVNTLQNSPWTTSASWALSVIPMFVLMGMLLERSGVARDIFQAVRALLGRFPGGLAISTNFAGAAMGAASGSTLGITYTVGRIAIPEMVRNGYDRRFSAAAVLTAGTGGQLIPPSILLVVYAGIAQVPVGQQLIAGFVPGIAVHAVYALMMVAIVLMRPRIAPTSGEARLRGLERLRKGVGIWPVLLLIVVVLGGLYQGVFTSTEAGAYGVLAAMFVVLVLRGPSVLVKSVLPATRDTAVAVGAVFLILIGGAMFGRFMALSGLPRGFAEWLESANAGPVHFMLLVLVMYLALGMFMDPMAMMLITVPILLPVATAVGIDPIVFGVFVVLLGELAVLTPPVGILVFAVHRIARDSGVNLSLSEAFRGVSWFYPVTLLVALAMVLYPEFVLWLPGLMD
ncbi:TRAP transporter large permease [Haloactinomyces albus]|nr:TRAP transporter large permease [Haloactinomyces albus]